VKGVSKIALGTILVIGLAIWLFYPKESAKDLIPKPTGHIPSQEEIRKSQPPQQLFGESILAGYGSGSPENDLRQMHALVQNYRLLAKGMDARHFASNESVASVFRGENRIALQALPIDHRVFNNDGLIVDRWGSPLHFHLESAQKVSIYSAGPDTTLGTDDDYSFVSGIAKQGSAEF